MSAFYCYDWDPATIKAHLQAALTEGEILEVTRQCGRLQIETAGALSDVDEQALRAALTSISRTLFETNVCPITGTDLGTVERRVDPE